MKDAGCSEDNINRFLLCYQAGDVKGELKVLSNWVLDTELVDQLMFSINPGYDYQHGDYANGSAGERLALYRRCEMEGVGISVMKQNMELHADSCIQCGHCESRCPFHVRQMARMGEINFF